ncbi:hypothetical protein ACQYWQ_13545 [Streptomyces sp. P6-2-1]|uniref:hypothetical protein n=1 Tax=unclassified Streptomyces TaxID=2593676 RepID=UPI003D35B5C9
MYVVPRPVRESVLDRGTSRAAHPPTERRVLGEMYEGFAGLGPYEAPGLDSTGLTPDETADAVLGGRA